ncbi:MAG: MltA domain-containing protein [Candidatus Paracaedibacteraceae bacterium]|nr:MltA domain-containing protein [Candidatus Paracaedibacteraceae bacterium]
MFKINIFCSLCILLCAILLSGCETRLVSNLNYKQVSFDDLPNFETDNLVETATALKRSCIKMLQQSSKKYPVPHASNLTGHLNDWSPFCKTLILENGHTTKTLKAVIKEHLIPYKMSVGSNDEGHITGYYEPLLHGSKRRHGRYTTPLYRYPSNKKINIKIPRAKIVKGAFKGKKLELVWVDSAVDAFFLQIQGSGRVKLDTGEVMRLGYAGTNKHAYHPIGKTLLDDGELQRGNVSMQAIRKWLQDHPKRAEEVMSTNESYVFFRELTNNDGPIGSQGVPLTPKRSLAVDTHYLGLGTPLWVDIDHPTQSTRLQHLAVAQDTGGAIKGALRADYFWGFGKHETEQAGKMNSKGHLYVLLPKVANGR